MPNHSHTNIYLNIIINSHITSHGVLGFWVGVHHWLMAPFNCSNRSYVNVYYMKDGPAKNAFWFDYNTRGNQVHN